MSSHLSDTQLAVLRRALLKKGAELNEKLVRLLNEQGRAPVVMPGANDPGETAVEKLQRFLALVDGKAKALRSGAVSGFGLCESCGAPISFTELEQVPWADRCRGCSDPLKSA